MGLNTYVRITPHSQIAEIDAFIKRTHDMNPHRLETLAGVPIGTIKNLRSPDRKLALNAGTWQQLKNIMDEEEAAKVFDVDTELMQSSYACIKAVSGRTPIRLTDAEQMAYTVRLYNHVMKYRGQGEQIEPSRPLAELIIYKTTNQN